MEQIKVGDILYGMHHYSMHYPVWFRVIKVTEKQAQAVRLRSVMIQSTDGYGQQGYEVPSVEECDYDRGPHTIREDKNGELETGSYKRWNHYCLNKWNGKPIWADHMD